MASHPWIHITTGASDMGFGVVTYEVDSYIGKLPPRTGSITVNTPAGTNNPVHTVYQTSVICSATLSPTGKTFYREGGSGSFALSTFGECEWEAKPDLASRTWITIQSGATGVGSGTVTFGVDPGSKLDRSGTITAGGQTFAVTQLGSSCSYGVSPASRSFGSSGGAGSVSVAAADTCEWTAMSNAHWITVTSGGSGTGNGTAEYSVAANPAVNVSRSGTISVPGQLHTVTQSGVPCSYTILPSSADFTHTGGAGSLGVTADGACNWTVASNAGWIIVTSGASGSGTGSVGYSVAANSSGLSRIGTVTAAGRTHTVTQAGAPCTYGLSSTWAASGAGGGPGSFGVTSPGGCGWSAVSQAAWISIVSGTGSGSGTVSYSVAPNTHANPRSGTLTVGGQTFTVEQTGVVCSYSIDLDVADFSASGGPGTINVTAPDGCGWIGSSDAPWIVITSGSGGGTGTLAYSVEENLTAMGRNGHVSLAGQVHTVNQTGLPCTFGVSPQEASFSHWGGLGSFDVTTPEGCGWSAASQDDWILVTSGQSGSGGGTVHYQVEPNLTDQDAAGTVVVADRTFTVRQSAGPLPDLDGDGDVDGSDLAAFIQRYINGLPEGDMDHDLMVGFGDVESFAERFGEAD
jgi:hypothetical protein